MCRKLSYLVPTAFCLSLFLTGLAKADLVAWWRFDDGSGSSAHDSSSNGHHGTVAGTPTWASGAQGIGGALAFGPGKCHGVDCGVFDPTNGTGQFTITFWAFWEGTGSTQRFVSKANSWGPDTMMFQTELWAAHSNSRFTDRVGISYKGGPGSVPFSLMPKGQWVHLAFTFDGTNATVLVNGVDDVGPQAFSIGPNIDAPVLIGARSITAAGDRVFEGSLDDMRIYERALTPDEILETMCPGQVLGASGPSPADGAIDVPRDVILSWTPGELADKHNVYFGTNFDDVNDASPTVDPGGVYLGRQDPNYYPVDGALVLDFGQTYFWRVDEVNAPPDYTIFKGNVWSFMAEPVGYPLTSENITTTASSELPNMGPENTVNGSGLDAGDLHSALGTDMWLSGSEPLGAWIQYEFNKAYKLHEMWVWNSNQLVESFVGFGIKEVILEYSLDGLDWTKLEGVSEFTQAPGAEGYAPSTVVNFGGTAAKFVKIRALSSWGALPQYGLSEVRLFYIPVFAIEPNPDFGATDVSIGTIDEPTDVTLGFRAGREAAKHNVYLSSNQQAVIDGTADVTTVTETSYGPLPLDLGQTYYWRVDEVNEAETPATWQGELWNFTTQEYFILDDIESYNDLDPGDPNSNRIFLTWIDGWEVPTNGSQVGYSEPPFCEQTIVHGGEQSMPLFYDNSGTARYSEAELTLSPAQDWTKKGVEALSLWFYGDPNNAAEQMYVKVNGSKVIYVGDAADTKQASWKQWTIDLTSFGVGLRNVTKLAIGFGDETNLAPGGSGVVYFDDIRLYPLREPEANLTGN